MKTDEVLLENLAWSVKTMKSFLVEEVQFVCQVNPAWSVETEEVLLVGEN